MKTPPDAWLCSSDWCGGGSIAGQLFICGEAKIDETLPPLGRNAVPAAPVTDVERFDVIANHGRKTHIGASVADDLLVASHLIDIALCYANVKAYCYVGFATQPA